MLDTTYNADACRYEVLVDGHLYQHVMSGYCGRLLRNVAPEAHGRLFANTPREAESIVELYDGRLVRSGTESEHIWMIGTYIRGVRLGTCPRNPQLMELANQTDMRMR